MRRPTPQPHCCLRGRGRCCSLQARVSPLLTPHSELMMASVRGCSRHQVGFHHPIPQAPSHPRPGISETHATRRCCVQVPVQSCTHNCWWATAGGSFAAGTVKADGSRQTIDLARGRVANEASFRLGGINAKIVVGGLATPVSNTRLDVVFDEFQLVRGIPSSLEHLVSVLRAGRVRCFAEDAHPDRFRAQALGPLQTRLPLNVLSPRGAIETTFLDSSLRIGRGDKGSIFVCRRLGAPAAYCEG